MSIHDIFVIVVGLICIWVLVMYFIEIRKVRRLYAELKMEQEIFRQRQAQWAWDMLYTAHDPELTKEEMIQTIEEFYHEIEGDAILKRIKK